MAKRGAVVIGLGCVGLAIAWLWLREDPPPASARMTVEQVRARQAAPAARPRPVRHAPPRGPDRSSRDSPLAEQPVSEQRDQTGEPLSAGPAAPVSLPERPEAERTNVPSPQESEAAVSRVLARLDREIEEARAAGDTAEVERLEVRRARLQRKQRQRQQQEVAEASDSAAEDAREPSAP